MTREELIAALEAATGPSRELDGDIAVFVRLPIKPVYIRGQAPRYTASIDAALTLVPEGYGWSYGTHLGRDETGLYVPAAYVDANQGRGATPAIALCIAALKARAA